MILRHFTSSLNRLFFVIVPLYSSSRVSRSTTLSRSDLRKGDLPLPLLLLEELVALGFFIFSPSNAIIDLKKSIVSSQAQIKLHSSFWTRTSSSSWQTTSSKMLVIYTDIAPPAKELKACDSAMTDWSCPIVLVVSLELFLLKDVLF